MKKITFITFIVFVFFVSKVNSQSLLYSNVGVSDGGTTNSIGQANTSRNVDVDINGNIGVVYLGDQGLRFAKSIDRGQSFLPTVLLKNVTVGDCEVNMADNKTIYIVYSNGSQISLFVSLDEGSTFSSEIMVGAGSTPHIASYGSSVFIVTQNGSQVYRYSNNGQGAFTSLSTPGSWAFADIRTDRSNGDVYLIADNPNLFMYRSIDNCDTWVNQGITGSVFYSSYSLTTNAIGNYVYTAGSGANGYKITFGGGSATATAVSVGNNVVSTGRTLSSDSFGNFVDGYSASASQLKIGVSNDFAATFPNTFTIDNATSQNVVINPKFQDVVCTYSGTDGKIYLNVYRDYISGLSISNVSSEYCLGGTSAISYNSAKSIFNSGNQFIVQLSDQNRSFTSPIVIGSLTSVVSSGSIPITIPSSVLPGNEYRIRVVSTDNSFVGVDNGFDITIPSSVKVLGKGGIRYLDQAGQLVIDPSTLDNGSSGCTDLTFSASPNTFNCTNLGANNVVFTAKDESGKDASVSVVITVKDNLSPVIFSNGDKNVTADANLCGAAVVVSATATDNCTVGLPTGVRSDALALDAIYPVGTTTITWNVTDGAGLTATSTQIVTVQDVTDPVITCPENISVNNDSGVCTANVSIPSGGNTPPKILLVAADDQTWVADVQSKLIATGAFNSVDLFDATSGTPSTALLANYKAVLVWTDENANNPTLLGDNLVSYIDNGGGVVSMVFDIASVPISGAFNTDAYRCLVPDSQTQGSTESLGTIYDAAHPIMSGVVSFNGGTSSYRSDSNTLATGAIKVADWTDGLPLVVVKENVGLSNVRRADLNFFPPSTNSRGDFWDAATDGDLLMKNALLWVAGSTSSAGGAVASDSCSNTITITNNITGTNDASGVYPVGTTNVVWTATDASGNSSSCTQTVTVMDAENPTIATLSAMNANADAGVCTYASAQLTAPTAADNCSVIMVVASPASLVSGANTVTWTVTDGAGLTATSTQIVTVVDAENPTIAALSAMNVNADAGVCTYVSSQLTTPTTADNCSVVSVVASPASLVSGENIVTWTVTDSSGLTATSTQTITVIDTQNPTIATLSAMNVNADAGVCTYVSTQLTAPLATDNCSVVSVVVSPASLVSGANTVTWTVTDGSGLTATSTQTVTVVDKVAPVVVTKNMTIQLNAAGTASIVVADVNNGSTDNCGISLVELDKMAFTCANVGANTVTLKVTDNNGNVATQTAIITVEDKIAPVVIVKNITVQLDASSNILIAGADVNNGSTDNCGISLLELDKALFSCANVGDNIVTLKVTDNSGNVATRTAIVTIVNSQPNLIRKHFDDVIFFDNSSKAFVAFSWYKNGVLVPGQTAQYFKDSGVLNGTYYAKATKIDGTVVTTCPLTFSASIVDEYLKIAPNPVKSNASYQILTNVDSAKLQNARITVFNILGVLVNDKMVDGKTTDMIAPNTEGIYVVRMTLANGKYFTKNLLVKN
jgi:hypothetical protein